MTVHIFSDFSDAIKPQPNLQMMQIANGLSAQGRDIIHLEIGDNSTAFKNQVLQDILQQTVENPHMGYCPAEGLHDLRVRFAEINSREKNSIFGADNIAISAGNVFIYYYFATLCNAGDTILLPDPGYHVFYLVAQALNLRVIAYPNMESQGWAPDTDFIENAIKTHTVKAIVINNPSNPLGRAVSGDCIAPILQTCYTHGVPVLMDETYKNLVYDDTDISTRHYPNISYLYSLSKDAVCPAFRMGYLLGNSDIIQRINNMNSLMYSCQPAFIQQATLTYLNSGCDYTSVIRHTMQRRIKTVCNTLSHVENISFNTPNAAFYLFINISKLSINSEEFCLDLLEKQGVCTCPGAYFGPTGKKGYIRINMATEESLVSAGINRMIAYIDTYI